MAIKQENAQRDKIIYHTGIYAFAQYVTSFLGLIRAFIVAKMLGPFLYGYRHIFDIIINFAGYSHFGTIVGMNREVPHYRGSGDIKKERLIISSVFWANLLFIMIAGACISVSSFYLRSKAIIDQRYCDVLFFSGLMIISTRVTHYYQVKLKLDKKVPILSLVNLIGRLNGIVLCIALTYFFSLRGFLAGVLIGDVILLIMYIKVDSDSPALNISLSIIKEVFKVGFPIMSVGIMLMLLGSTDKIMILKYLSEEALGLYGISSFIGMVLGMVPATLYQVTLPYIVEEYGKSKNIHKISNYFEEPTILLAYMYPYLMSLIYFSIHIPIYYYLDRYIPSIIVIQILTIGYFFASLREMAISICITVNKQLILLLFTVPAIILNAILNYVFICRGMGINGVAIGTSVTQFVFSTIILIFTLKLYQRGPAEICRFLIKIFLPLVYSLFLIVSIDVLVDFQSIGLWQDSIFAISKIAIFFVFYSSLILIMRNDSAFQKLRISIKSFYSKKFGIVRA